MPRIANTADPRRLSGGSAPGFGRRVCLAALGGALALGCLAALPAPRCASASDWFSRLRADAGASAQAATDGEASTDGGAASEAAEPAGAEPGTASGFEPAGAEAATVFHAGETVSLGGVDVVLPETVEGSLSSSGGVDTLTCTTGSGSSFTVAADPSSGRPAPSMGDDEAVQAILALPGSAGLSYLEAVAYANPGGSFSALFFLDAEAGRVAAYAAVPSAADRGYSVLRLSLPVDTFEAVFPLVDEMLSTAEASAGEGARPGSSGAADAQVRDGILSTLAGAKGSSAASASYKDGVFIAASEGYDGDVMVSVTVEGGVVTDVTVGSGGDALAEDAPAARMFQEAPARIVELQGVDGLDAVSGATVSQDALVAAVRQCLDAAAL